MGKKRGSRAVPVRRVPRVVRYPNANHRLRNTTVRLSSLPSLPVSQGPLIEIEDRRAFSPSGPYRSARSMTRTHHDLVASPFGRFSDAIGVGFSNPKKVLVCIRRKQRREVLLAKGRGGKNARPRRNYYSDVRC